MKEEIYIRVGGAAGQGGASTGETIAKNFARHGLNVCTQTSYQSAIRGGHNWIEIRASDKTFYSQGDGLDILIALNQHTVEIHGKKITHSGGIIYDINKIRDVDNFIDSSVTKFGLPMTELLNKSLDMVSNKYGQETAQKFGKLPVQNTIMIGTLVHLLSLKFEVLESVIKTIFGKKKIEVIEFNIDLAKNAYTYSKTNFLPIKHSLKFSNVQKILITGNFATAIGAVASECKFYSAYPMTPASSILHWLTSHSKSYGVAVKQCEDELSVINMAIGASHGGVRSMCGTSGGGFSLMVEAIGMAGMAEIPVVIVNSQRTGPSTGLPTKTEQADLNLMFGAGAGDFPKIILAPRDISECYSTTCEAFNLADKYQCPVIIALDLYLSEHYQTTEAFDFNVKIDRGELAKENTTDLIYNRYKLTTSGISPRAIPGQEGNMFTVATDEHNEHGDVISDVFAGIPEHIIMREKQMNKRMNKMTLIQDDIQLPEIWGDDNAQITLLGWGSTWSQIKDAINLLQKNGKSVNSIQYKYIWPFKDRESEELLKSCKKIVLVESNYTGQFGSLVTSNTGINIKNKILKYNGEPLYPLEIQTGVEKIINDGDDKIIHIEVEGIING